MNDYAKRIGILGGLAVAIFIGLFATGCAGERVAVTAAKTVDTAVTTLANKIPITAGNIQANGKIQNPAYTGEFLYVQGVKFKVQLEGAEVNGQLYGQGEGGNNSYDPEFAALLERARKGEPGALDKLLDLVRELSAKNPKNQSGADGGAPPPGAPLQPNARADDPIPLRVARANASARIE